MPTLSERAKRIPVTVGVVGLALLATLGVYASTTFLRLGVLHLGVGFEPSRLHTFVSYAFLHSSILHWALNALWIVLLGAMLEPRLGAKAFLVVTLVSVVAGGVFLALLYGGIAPFLGASPLIYAYLGSLAWLMVRRKVSFSKREFIIAAVVAALSLVPLPDLFPAYAATAVTGVLMGIFTSSAARSETLPSHRTA